jgi:SAM-dependent methyltransferase
MNITYITITPTLLKRIIVETLRGKSLMRIFMNHALSSYTLEGAVLDLGSKSDAASYNRFLQKKEGVHVTYTDIDGRAGDNIVSLDLEKPFPMQERSFNMITCFNTLEHIYNYSNIIHESHRVLKQGGRFIGATPFLVNFHPDPKDYFRYTHQALVPLFEHVGFRTKEIVPLSIGPFTASVAMHWFVLPRITRPFFILQALLLDWIVLKLKKQYKGKYPLGYVFVFEK